MAESINILSAGTASQATEDPVYACPQSRSLLQRQGDRYLTLEGAGAYEIRNGVPLFLRYPVSGQPDEMASLERLNTLCLSKGWKAALEETYGAGSNFYRYVTDERRAGFLDLLPLTAQSRVLELGPGLGQFTVPIGQRVREVYGLEVIPGQADFCLERCRQSGVHNLQMACGGDDCRLPYRDGVFDVAICNLVFEWCALRGDEPPMRMQERFVQEIARVLRPGGVFYLATKNRYQLRYLLGRPDEHSANMPFGSALPRWVRNAYLTGRKRQSRAVLYSYPALRRLLGRQGLPVEKAFWSAPEYRFPTRFVPLEPAAIRAARAEAGFPHGHTRLTRLLMPRLPAAWLKYVTPGLSLLARKAGGAAGA